MRVLRLKDVSKVFVSDRGSERKALESVTLEFAQRELCVLLGENGAGKTTLFNVIGGQVQPDTGSVTFMGTPIIGVQPYRRADFITRVYQSRDSGIPRSLRVEEVLELVLRSKRISCSLQNIRDVLARTRSGLERIIGKQVWHLSGGEHQLLSLTVARILVESGGFHVLLLDEHTSQLDLHAKELVLETTVRLVEETDATGIIATHDVELGATIGSRQIVLHEGRVVEDRRRTDRIQEPSQLADLLKSYSCGADRHSYGEDVP